MPPEPISVNQRNFGMVRGQEAKGFIWGLFNGANEVELPERAEEAVIYLGDIWVIMLAVADFIGRAPTEPEDRSQIKETIRHLRTMTEFMEAEILAAVLSCCHARQQGLLGP